MGIPLWIYRKLQGNLQNRYSERMPNSYIKGKNVFLVARQKAKVHSLHFDYYGMLMTAQCFFTLEKSETRFYKNQTRMNCHRKGKARKDWNSKTQNP